MHPSSSNRSHTVLQGSVREEVDMMTTARVLEENIWNLGSVEVLCSIGQNQRLLTRRKVLERSLRNPIMRSIVSLVEANDPNRERKVTFQLELAKALRVIEPVYPRTRDPKLGELLAQAEARLG